MWVKNEERKMLRCNKLRLYGEDTIEAYKFTNEKRLNYSSFNRDSTQMINVERLSLGLVLLGDLPYQSLVT